MNEPSAKNRTTHALLPDRLAPKGIRCPDQLTRAKPNIVGQIISRQNPKTKPAKKLLNLFANDMNYTVKKDCLTNLRK